MFSQKYNAINIGEVWESWAIFYIFFSDIKTNDFRNKK